MVKIKHNHALILFLVIALITVSSCSKQQCNTTSDCLSKKCFLPICENKKCNYVLQRNCCGNRLNESIEDGKPGSKCTCPADYGKCEGKGKVNTGSKLEDAVYVHHYCNEDDKCVFGAEKSDISEQNYLDMVNAGFFKASSVIKYNKPFDVNSDNFEFTISLDDAKEDVVFPIELTRLKLLYTSGYKGELLIGEKEMHSRLNGIGDKIIIKMPLNLNYKPEELEESGSMRYAIDYMYTNQVRIGKDQTNLDTVRATFTAPAKKVFLIRSENG